MVWVFGQAKTVNQLFILDACFGGLIADRESTAYEKRPWPDYLDFVTENDARQFITAGGKDQRVKDGGPKGYSYFTGFLLEGLTEGKADLYPDGYITFAEATGRNKPNDEGWGRGRRPVIEVSWEDAVDYADWLSRETGKRYRLPTEAEWEYAARGGTTTARFWGDDPSRACQYANVADRTAKENYSSWSNIHECRDGYVHTAPVGAFKPNKNELYDVLGNVWEWTCSGYEESYAGKEQHCISKNHACRRVVRGGSWSYGPRYLRSAARYGGAPDYRVNVVGFRLAQD